MHFLYHCISVIAAVKSFSHNYYLLSFCRCGVVWGDYSQPDAKGLLNLNPCEVIHQYPKTKAQYTVNAYYCSQPAGGDLCCAHYMGTISF